MKALTMTEPWGSLVVSGAKKIETRGWGTRHRGPLAIHAAKTITDGSHRLLEWDYQPLQRALHEAGIYNRKDLPLGMVIGVVTLVDCIRMDEAFVARLATAKESDLEYWVGQFAPGRFAWILADPYRLEEPIKTKGALQLWEWKPPPYVELRFLEKEEPVG